MTDILRRLHCTIRCDIETAESGCHCAEGRDTITALRAEVEKLKGLRISLIASPSTRERAMADITIPPEALEAAARAICAGNKWNQPCAKCCTDCVPEARAACIAMLRAWPGMATRLANSVNVEPRTRQIILPLTESGDE